MPARKYCSIPWLGVTLNPYKGIMSWSCCTNPTVYGDIKRQTLEEIWRSETSQEFRRRIVNGEYPDDFCRACHQSRKHFTIGRHMRVPFMRELMGIENHIGRRPEELARFLPLMNMVDMDDRAQRILQDFNSCLDSLARVAPQHGERFQLHVANLRTVGRVVEAFLEGNDNPPVIAPHRQVNLILRCNANCIQCPGRFLSPHEKKQTAKIIPFEELKGCFDHTEDILAFYMTGTELLFYPDWKDVAGFLKRAGVRLQLSTNTIQLTPENTEYLIDNDLVDKLNVSLDGARKETVEAIRRRVKYEEMVRNVGYFYEYAYRKRYKTFLGFSFVLMTLNCSELGEFVRLVDRLRHASPEPTFTPTTIRVQNLCSVGTPAYLEFAKSVDPSTVSRADLQGYFREMLAWSKAVGINVDIFSVYSLEEFIADGCRWPAVGKTLCAQQCDGVEEGAPATAALAGTWPTMGAWTPVRVFVDLVGARNRRGPSCEERSEPEAGMPRMQPALLGQILDKVKRESAFSRVVLCDSGARLPDLQLPEMVRVVKQRLLPCAIATNLSFPELPGLENAFRAGLDLLEVSWSGLTQNHTNEHSARDLVELGRRNLLRLKELVDASNAKARIVVHFEQYEDSAEDERRMRELASSLGFDFLITPALLKPAEDVVAYLEGSGPSREWNGEIERLAVRPEDGRALASSLPDRKCGFRINSVVLDVKGDCYLCQMASCAGDHVLGEFLEVSAAELQQKRDMHPFCKRCMASGVDVYYNKATELLAEKRKQAQKPGRFRRAA